MVLLIAFLAILGAASAEKEQSRWSRQISSYTADISDWVPLPGPVDEELPQIRRQSIAEPRILSEPFPGFAKPTGFGQDVFPARNYYNSPANRQLYLQSVPSAPQNYLSEQGFNQGLRFGLTQPNFPLSQGFVAPQFSFDSIPQTKQRPQLVPNPIKFDNSPPKSIIPVSTPTKSFSNQAPKAKPDTPKFVDGYRIENSSDTIFAKKKPQSLHKIKFETADKSKEVFDNGKTKVEREEVQLLYVPVESLNRGQFNFRNPLTPAQILNTELYNQNSKPNPLMQNLAGELQRPALQPINMFNSQDFLTKFNSHLHETDNVPKFSTLTTPFPITIPTTTVKPKKLKPHQPPLAIFLADDAKKNDQVKVGDVLHSLKNANTVAVLDSVNPLNAPKVFIGPSSLLPPENYVKFELPYLSNIENIDKKLKQLPFFVAPLSYNTPQGFAKIPFPSPHVGSVVINSLIKDTPSINKPTVPTTNVYSNTYSRPSVYQEEQKHQTVTQRPVISYYSTSAPRTTTTNFEQSYYSIEPQSVNTFRPIKHSEENPALTQSTPYKTGTYFLHNTGNQYNPPQFVNFPQEANYRPSEAAKIQKAFKPETTTTSRTTITTTTRPPSTYPSQLLETHNPYSINQAFHFSTPLDYQNFFDEYKEPNANQGISQPQTPPSVAVTTTPVPTTKKIEIDQQKITIQPQQSPNYLQNYNPEIHHQSDVHSSRYPVFNKNEYYTNSEPVIQTDNANFNNPVSPDGDIQTVSYNNPSQENTDAIETQSPLSEKEESKLHETAVEDSQSTKSSSPEYNQYDSSYSSQESSSSTSSSTTTTRKTPIRTRGRPRYPTIKTESYEQSTRTTITRRPLRERKPSPVRPRYEPNKISTETPTKKPLDSSESTTKPTRTRIRGRVHYKPSDNDDIYTKKYKANSKENDLAYQRDVLHQNYPVTLMERTSTLDIEAITEPTDKGISTSNLEGLKTEDTVDAYSHDKLSITGPITSESKDVSPSYTTALDSVTDATFVPKIPTRYDEYNYQTNGNVAAQDTLESNGEPKEERYTYQTSSEQEAVNQEILFDTKESNPAIEENTPVYSNNDDTETTGHVDVTFTPEGESNVKQTSQEQEDNIVETTPSYNRVRVRPGVIRQYHQASSTESSRTRTDRRKPLQAITYRPAFDRRRTTMRIEEIEADLKTKQVHIRPEFQDYKQPIYKPDPTSEPITSTSTTETSRHNQFRRRRPSYVSTSTEGTVTRRPYEIKNRYRGRRPTEKPTEKSELSTEASSTTVKTNLYNRYSHRPRLSERYNKKEETEDQVPEDQDSNYSINRPKYAAPESERWSPKMSKDSFKPYNPNNIADDTKSEVSNIKTQDEELDIITAKNEYEDILISVTPATNNRVNKKIPDIPPTLEALVEQSKVTKSDTTDTMSTFESMLEEVMKSLEEQDENEYTSNVMKHKGGEIGEIPPERIISSGENYSLKSTTPLQEETTTALPATDSSSNVTEEVPSRKTRRRGFWKKVKVRPVAEEIDVAESQYYPHVINRLGQFVSSKASLEKPGKGSTKLSVTTYKPNYQFLKDFFKTDEEMLDLIPNIDIPKINTSDIENKTKFLKASVTTTVNPDTVFPTEKNNPGDMDLGTGSPEPSVDYNAYYSESTEATSSAVTSIDRSDGFSFMEYLFGVTSPDNTNSVKNYTTASTIEIKATTQLPKDVELETEPSKIKATTESTYVPDEITTEVDNDNNESVTETASESFIQKINKEIKELTEKSIVKVESSSVSTFMDPANVVSTSMSTEVSHETEICFRGKCIKTNKNIL